MKGLQSKKLFLVACVLSSAIGVLTSTTTSADQFDWRNVNGQDFITPVENQGGLGVCWAFAPIGTLEANYKITRNDPTFNIDLSEQNLICDVWQAVPGVTTPFTTGICTDAELPYTQESPTLFIPCSPAGRTASSSARWTQWCVRRFCHHEGRIEDLWPVGHRYFCR